MNNNLEYKAHEETHDPLHQEHSINSNPRVIEIPVQHFTAPANSANLNNNLTANPGSEHFKNQNDFFNRQSLFDDFQSPFGDLIEGPQLRNRSLFNRDHPFSSRFDDFFRPHLSTSPQSTVDSFLGRQNKSPARDILRQQQPGIRQGSPIPGLNDNYFVDHQQQAQPQARQSPTVSRTESPKLSATQQSAIQIPIQHIPVATSSDFKHQIPSRLRTDSPPIIRHVTPPSTKPVEPSLQFQSHHQHNQQQPTNKPKQPSPPVVAKQPEQVQHINTNSDFKHQIQPVSQELPQPQQQPTKTSRFEIPAQNSTTNKQSAQNSTTNKQSAQNSTTNKQSAQTVTKAPATEIKETQEKSKEVHSQPKKQSEKSSESSNAQSASQTSPAQGEDYSTKMGNSFQGQNSSNKRHATNSESSDFTHSNQSRGSAHPEKPTTQAPPPPQPIIKSSKEKLESIAKELNTLENEINTVNTGCGKRDKLYLKLDEYLTRCLLKLDEIERSEEINTFRKYLINLSNQLLDKLENIALGNAPAPSEQSENSAANSNSAAPSQATHESEVSMDVLKTHVDNISVSKDDCDSPHSKRAKSPSNDNENLAQVNLSNIQDDKTDSKTAESVELGGSKPQTDENATN